MRYLVTGAAGFIGSHLSEKLLAQGDRVLAVDSLSDYYDPALKEENARAFELQRLDLVSTSLENLLDQVDGVFHLAGQPGVRSSFGLGFSAYVDRNIVATQRLFEAASRVRVPVVFASSSSIYGNAETYPTPEETEPQPISPYGITKLACEHLASAYRHNFGLDVIGLRYFTVYGPRQRPDMAFTKLVTSVVEKTEFELFGDGAQSRSFTYVADAVQATIAAMQRGRWGSIYNVGGGSEATMVEVIALLEELSGSTVAVARRGQQAGDVRRTAADCSRIRRDLDWEAETPLREGLSNQLAWAASRQRDASARSQAV